MKKYQKLFLILVFINLVSNGFAQSVSTIQDFVKTKADSFFVKNKLPGILVVWNDGKTNELYTNGFANLDTKKLFDLNTVFEAGSITKTYTAFVVTSVLRDNKINESTSIIEFLPDSLKANKSLAHITFLHLLNHTSGLPRLPANFDIEEGDMQPYKFYTEKKLFTYLKNAEIKNENKNEYSNLGNALAGVIAARIAKKSYQKLLEQYIFLPFKMKDEDKNLLKYKNKSQGHFAGNTKVDYWDMNVLSPAGGLKCSAAEMIKYLQNISNAANEATKKIVDSLLSPTVTLNPKIRIARAWHTYEQKSKPIVYWHNGGTYGFSTFVGFVKNTNKKVVVVINRFNENAAADFIGISIMKKLTE